PVAKVIPTAPTGAPGGMVVSSTAVVGLVTVITPMFNPCPAVTCVVPCTQWVLTPVTSSVGALFCGLPVMQVGGPEGERHTLAIAADEGVTEKPKLNVVGSVVADTSVPVRPPSAASMAIEMLASTVCAAASTVTELTVMPLSPKLTLTCPGWKLVNWPPMITSRFCVPLVVNNGRTPVSLGVAASTVKAPLSPTTSPPVVTVTSCGPTLAPGATERSTVRLVGFTT